MTHGPPELTLRPLALTDAPRVHEWASQPVACRFQVWGPNTVEQTTAYVAEAVRHWNVPDQRRWTWAAVDGSGVLVGIGDVHLLSASTAEISYSVHTSLWGQGYATALARMLIEWAWGHWDGLERMQATCDPRNAASAAVLRKLGMTHEGTMRHTLLLRDGWRDSQMFSVLRDER